MVSWRIASRAASASAGLFTTRIPPAFPRPPASTWALRATGEGRERSCSCEATRTPRGTGIPYAARISFPLCSRSFAVRPHRGHDRPGYDALVGSGKGFEGACVPARDGGGQEAVPEARADPVAAGHALRGGAPRRDERHGLPGEEARRGVRGLEADARGAEERDLHVPGRGDGPRRDGHPPRAPPPPTVHRCPRLYRGDTVPRPLRGPWRPALPRDAHGGRRRPPDSAREIGAGVGKALRGKEKAKNSILVAAYESGVPVFVPALGDSSLGFSIMFGNRRAGKKVIVDMMKDVDEITRIAEASPQSSVVIVGGGVPKNFVQQTAVIAGYQTRHDRMHRLALQITTDSPQWGGLSGCTLEESVSW